MVVSFTAITVFIYSIFPDSQINTYEVVIAIIFVVLLGVGSSPSHKQHWNQFMQERKIAEINNQLVIISQADDLTRIYNRRKSLEELENEIELAKRYHTNFCVAILDIDNFKSINDTYSHIIGDSCLKEFAGFIKNALRVTDILGRWCGEEFIVIIPHSKKEDAHAFIDRLSKLMEGHSFKDVDKILFSTGLCEYADGFTAYYMIDNAYNALYSSKNNGRNCTSTYDK